MATHVTARLFQATPKDPGFQKALTKLNDLEHEKRIVTRGPEARLYSIAVPESNGLGLWILRTGVDLHQDGEIKPWDLNADVAEGSYFRFFPKGIVVMLATGHGPRTSALSGYLFDLTGLDVYFDAILRVDNVLYVSSLDEVKRIELTISGPDVVSELRSINETLGTAAASLITASGSDKLSMTFDGIDPDSRDAMWHHSRGWLQPLIGHLPIPGLDRLHIVVKGEISGEEDVDVIKDRVTYQMQVPSGKRLDIETAFAVSARAYDRYIHDTR